MKRLYSIILFVMCALTVALQTAKAQSDEKDVSFRITVLKTTGAPQSGIQLRIFGQSERYTADDKGVISFSTKINKNYTRSAALHFPYDADHSVCSFTLKEDDATKTIYIDSADDITAFKKDNVTVEVEGIVNNSSGHPISGVIVSIQGTGRKTVTDEIGLFKIEADYKHPVTLRADGMDNMSINTSLFLQNPNEPYRITMFPKNPGKIYNVVEHMPEYPGGRKEFMNYLKRHLKYPAQAKKENKQGVVVVQFVVETNGEITSPTIARGLEAQMDTAALNVIREMPSWMPGRDHGRVVRCKCSVPVQFKIEQPKPKPHPVLADTTAVHKEVEKPEVTDSISSGKSLLTLSADSISFMTTDSLVLQKDSLLKKAEQLIQSADSLSISKADSVSTENQAVTSTPKPRKKGNIFVRFFRWLFGKKN